MIKAVFFDIDGTLLAHNLGRIPEDTLEALERLRKKGVKAFISSGRHYLELIHLGISHIPFDGYVFLNGQICLDKKKDVIYSSSLHKEDMEYFGKLFAEKRIPMSIVEKDRLYVNFVNDLVRIAVAAVSSPVPPVGEYGGEDIFLAMVYGDEEVCDEILLHMPHCKLTRWNSDGADIVDKNCNKVIGMEKLMELYNISREEIMAFGDGDNDTEMLEFAGIGVAMGNAEDPVKACADYVTLDVDKGGIVHALEHFGVLEKE